MAVKNRIGVVGSGPISCAMIDAINESSNGEVMGIWGEDPILSRSLQRKRSF